MTAKAIVGSLLRFIVLVLVVGLILFGPLAVAAVARRMGSTHELGIEAARLVYGWPVIVGVCVIVFLVTFRSPLHAFLRGVRRLKAGGVEMETEQQALPTTDLDPRKGEVTWEKWFLDLGSKLSTIDREVIGQLGKMQQQAFTQWIQRWWFEKVWGRIYATQVGLVELLAAQPAADAVAVENAIMLFERHVEERIAANPPMGEFLKTQEQKGAYFVQWLGFLESARLIEVRDKSVARTPLTVEFVAYMRAEGYTRQMRMW